MLDISYICLVATVKYLAVLGVDDLIQLLLARDLRRLADRGCILRHLHLRSGVNVNPSESVR